MTEEKKIRPFIKGSDAADWTAKNCDICTKQFRHDQGQYHCQWQRELTIAFQTTGGISDKCATAIGITPATGGFYTWDCPSKILINAPPGRSRGPGAIPGQKNLFNGGNNGE